MVEGVLYVFLECSDEQTSDALLPLEHLVHADGARLARCGVTVIPSGRRSRRNVRADFS
jgi:hypothetical protein